ncbi:MAG: hypothetical protein ACX930_02310 [Erythrobacter sp.]
MLQTASINRYRTVFAVLALALLAVPLIAMQMSDDVNWTAGDFLAAAVLLFGLGAAIELAIRFAPSRAVRAAAVALALAAFVFVWAMLAVG